MLQGKFNVGVLENSKIFFNMARGWIAQHHTRDCLEEKKSFKLKLFKCFALKSCFPKLNE